MKKLLSVILLGLISTTVAFADGVKININGDAQVFPADSTPYINEDARTMVPVRFISEKLGAEVTYTDGLVQIVKKDRRIAIKVNEKWAIVNILGKSDSKKDLDTSVVLKEGRTFVPLRFVSEQLDTKVDWDANTKTVSIFTKDYVAPTPTVTVETIPTVTPYVGPEMIDENHVKLRDIADPETLPKIYFTKVSETGTRPKGFVEPKFYAKVVNNYTEYFTVYLENALDFNNVYKDCFFKVDYVDYPSLNTVADIFGNITILKENQFIKFVSNDTACEAFTKPELTQDKIKLYPNIKIKTKMTFKYKGYIQTYLTDVELKEIDQRDLY